MNSKLTLKVQKRSVTGKKVKNLRKAGTVPVSLYGKKIENVSGSVDLASFEPLYEHAGETQIVYVNVEGETSERPAIISNVQLHPVHDTIMHVDLRQVDLKEKIEADIPVVLVGESPAVKEAGASLVQLINEIRVEALPTNLPERFEVDITSLKAIGDVIRISDLTIDQSKVEMKVEDKSSIIVSANEQQKEEVIEAPAVAATPVASDATPDGTTPVASDATPTSPKTV